MILLNPIFDVHIRKINKIKVSAFAATEKAKRSLSDFFKANDFVYSFNRPELRRLVQHCHKNGLKIYIDDNLRYRNGRSQD
jgi:predicted peroxiredoxin